MAATRVAGIFDKPVPLPRRHRRLIVALFAIFVFLSILAWTSRRHNEDSVLATTPPPREPTHPAAPRTHHHNVPANRPTLRLAPEQELAAIVSFLGHIQTNGGLPPTVNPNFPIEPQLVLDFDTTSERAPAELKELVEDTWASNPVVIFAEVRRLRRVHPLGSLMETGRPYSLVRQPREMSRLCSLHTRFAQHL